MAISVSTLTDYVNEQGKDFILKTVYGGNTQKYVQVFEGIKGTQKLPILNTSIVLQAAGKGFTASGTTSITQATITVGDYKIEDELYVNDLDKKWTSTLLKKGMSQDQLPFEVSFMNDLENQIAKSIENKIWTASTGSGDFFNGFKTTVATASGALSAGSLTLTTAANVVDAFYTMANLLPADIQSADDLVLFCNPANFNKGAQGIMAAYPAIFSYQSDKTSYQGEEFYLPGTSVKIVKANGLGTSNRFFCGQASNFGIGTDSASDFSKIEMWYDINSNTVRYRVQFRLGTTAIFQDQLVMSANS